MPAVVTLVGGARPNFMKLAPLYRAFRRRDHFDVRFVHTGQHYDDSMTGTFFRELELPEPHAMLNVGSATHAVQTARVLDHFDDDLRASRPDLVVVAFYLNDSRPPWGFTFSDEVGHPGWLRRHSVAADIAKTVPAASAPFLEVV